MDTVLLVLAALLLLIDFLKPVRQLVLIFVDPRAVRIGVLPESCNIGQEEKEVRVSFYSQGLYEFFVGHYTPIIGIGVRCIGVVGRSCGGFVTGTGVFIGIGGFNPVRSPVNALPPRGGSNL